MQIEQHTWSTQHGWRTVHGSCHRSKAQLVLVFGNRYLLENAEHYEYIRTLYPAAHIFLCSTSGEIIGTAVYDNTIAVTAIEFAHTTVQTASVTVHAKSDGFQAGYALGMALPHEGLVHVFVLSDGHVVNGSTLVQGLKHALPSDMIITGGLAGDDNRFQRTLVGLNAPPAEGVIAIVGLYGDRLKVGYGSVGGWDAFGPNRLITKAENNVLYELDGRSALDIYKLYLGDEAKHLPSSALLFPLSIKPRIDSGHSLVRTILSIDEGNKSMIFAGDLPSGWYAQFMKANFDRLIDGAGQAAEVSSLILGSDTPDLSILISCIGRKNILADRVEEEVERVQEILGNDTAVTGFYSYGEISPLMFTASIASSSSCELHNQTMTITALKEY